MSEKINLSEYKRQIYLFYSEDGLADLAVGLMIFGFGCLLLVNVPGLVGLLGLFPFLLWYFGKQILVVPRVGSIQPGDEIKKRFMGFLINLSVLGAGFLVFYLINLRTGKSFMSSHPLALFGLVLGIGISSLGVMLKANRFYAYALVVFLAMAVGEYLGDTVKVVDPYLVAVISAGLIIMITGSIILARFINKYPVIKVDG